MPRTPAVRSFCIRATTPPSTRPFTCRTTRLFTTMTGTGYSGWWDYHTVGGPGTWQDDLYVSPKNFSHYSDDYRQIVMWGEMMGSGTADNHELILQQIQQGDGDSYDKQDHQQILDAYNLFLDKWDFRRAFPAASDLFVDIGNKSYDFWGRFLPMTR